MYSAFFLAFLDAGGDGCEGDNVVDDGAGDDTVGCAASGGVFGAGGAGDDRSGDAGGDGRGGCGSDSYKCVMQLDLDDLVYARSVYFIFLLYM